MRCVSITKDAFDKDKLGKNKYPGYHDSDNKPMLGLWFTIEDKGRTDPGFVSRWDEFCYSEYPDWYNHIKDKDGLCNVVTLDIDHTNSRILNIDSPESFHMIAERYGGADGRPHILDWEKIAEDYDGVVVGDESFDARNGIARLDVTDNFVLFRYDDKYMKVTETKEKLPNSRECISELQKFSRALEQPVTVYGYELGKGFKGFMDRNMIIESVKFGDKSVLPNQCIVSLNTPFEKQSGREVTIDIGRLFKEDNFAHKKPNDRSIYKTFEEVIQERQTNHRNNNSCRHQLLGLCMAGSRFYYEDISFDTLIGLEAISREAIKYDLIPEDGELKTSEIHTIYSDLWQNGAVYINGISKNENEREQLNDLKQRAQGKVFVANPQGDKSFCEWLSEQGIHIPEQILEHSRTLSKPLKGDGSFRHRMEIAKEMWGAAEKGELGRCVNELLGKEKEAITKSQEGRGDDEILEKFAGYNRRNRPTCYAQGMIGSKVPYGHSSGRSEK